MWECLHSNMYKYEYMLTYRFANSLKVCYIGARNHIIMLNYVPNNLLLVLEIPL